MANTVRLHPLAAERLKRLQSALAGEEGRTASYEAIVGALIYGTTPAQANGMLAAFTRATAEPSEDEPGTSG